MDATEFQNVIAALRRNGNERCATTHADQMSVEEMVDQVIDSEDDVALSSETSVHEPASSASAVERSRRRQVDDGVELDSARDDGAEVRLATMP